MTALVPNLDDRSYDELREEAIKMISKYFPEWTDHNPSDPGITLIELFVFLAEASIYSINFTPEKMLENFGKFFGVVRGQGESIEEVLRKAVENEQGISRAVNESDYEKLILSMFRDKVDRVCIVNSKTTLRKIKLKKLNICKNENYLIINSEELSGFRMTTYPKESIVEMFNDNNCMLYQTKLLEEFKPGKEFKTYLTRDYEKLNDVSYICIYTETPQADLGDSLVKIVVFPNKSIIADSDKRNLCDEVYKCIKCNSPVTSRFEVSTAFQENISLHVKVVFDSNSMIQRDDVKENVEEAIRNFLHPTNGGVDGKGWIIGRTLYKSELYYVIENVKGVDHVTYLEISKYERPLFGQQQFKDSKLSLSLSNGYFYLSDIKFEAGYD